MGESILSVGIDIGTTTTQLVFSRLEIENTAHGFSVPRISITDKQIVYESSIYYTPFITRDSIDSDRLRQIISGEYDKFGVKPNDVDTGAVIITGEAARKSNAEEVSRALSGFAGDFVVAAAGGDMESIIAGKGSGAEKLSRENNAAVINLDIGGGTTNISVFYKGEVMDTACMDIGGRLIRFDGNKKIEYMSDKVKKLALSSGIDVREGMEYGEQVEKLVSRMVEVLEEGLGRREKSSILENMFTDHPLKKVYTADFITFSGGVADYIYGEDAKDIFKFNDIGVILGTRIRQSMLFLTSVVKKPAQTIRATVVGAGSHTMKISGSTITYTKDLFPMKNIPILKITNEFNPETLELISGEIKDKLKWHMVEGKTEQFALAIKGMKSPGFSDVSRIASEIIKGLNGSMDENPPCIVIVESDMAKALGQTLYREMDHRREVVCIDSISVENGDYIDIGKPVANGRAIPVIIKTLVFNQ